jgi:prepilin-type processing-associated H-X9-DG protein
MPLGPQTISGGPNSTAIGQIRDGLSNTIAAGEIANSDIYWTEPRDLPLGVMNFRVNDRSQPSISSAHRGAAMVVFADGHKQTLSNSIDPSVLKALLTIAGAEEIRDDY